MSHISLKSAQNGLLNEMGGQFKDKMSNFGKLNFFPPIFHFKCKSLVPIWAKIANIKTKFIKFDIKHWMVMVNSFFAYKIFVKKTF